LARVDIINLDKLEEKRIGVSSKCRINSDCKEDFSCYEGRCVKLFDIKILDILSDTKREGLFDFKYLLKGMADINSDVIVNFWIEKDDKEISSGSDTIYIGSFEEKTEKTNLYLPDNVEEGTYRLYIQVLFGEYSAESYRTVYIEDRKIRFASPWDNLKIILIVFFITAALFFMYYHRNRLKEFSETLSKKSKKRKKE